jgi:hypothetical protein
MKSQYSAALVKSRKWCTLCQKWHYSTHGWGPAPNPANPERDPLKKPRFQPEQYTQESYRARGRYVHSGERVAPLARSHRTVFDDGELEQLAKDLKVGK